MLDFGARRGFLEWAELFLGFVATERGITAEVGFLYQAQGTNELQGHLIHLQLGVDGGEVTLEDEVHEERFDNVVLMMAESYLVAAEFACSIEERFASVPRAQETRIFLSCAVGDCVLVSCAVGDCVLVICAVGDCVLVSCAVDELRCCGRFAYLGVADKEGHMELVAERLQVRYISKVRAFAYAYVNSGDAETGHEDLRAATEELNQSQRVLASTEADKNVVALLDEGEVGTSLVEALGEAGLQLGEFYLIGSLHEIKMPLG